MKFKIGKLYKKYDLVIMYHRQTGDHLIAGTIVNDNDLYSIGHYGVNWGIEGWEEVIVNKKYHLTEEEIEKEVELRVKAKMHELFFNLTNRANMNWNQAFHSMNPKYSHYMDAFKEMQSMFKKELELVFPYKFNEMKEREDRRKIDEVISKISERLRLQGTKDRLQVEKFLYETIKKLQ